MILKKIKLLNFKGAQSREYSFDSHVVDIRGANRTGKTTLLDAFMWVLFGKNSIDQKDFSIKTYDSDNNVIPKIPHEVELTLGMDDGKDMVFRKSLVEKWTKKKGVGIEEFTGNETQCFIDEVPMQVTEYTKQISDIIDDRKFKLVTNPLHFNSMKWNDQLSILNELIDIFDVHAPLPDGVDQSNIEATKKVLVAKISKIKSELSQYEIRIDEVRRGKPETSETIEYWQSHADISTAEIQKIADNKLSAIEAIDAENQSYIAAYGELMLLRKKAAELTNTINEGRANAERIQAAVVEEKRIAASQTQSKIEHERNNYAIIMREYKATESSIEDINKNIEAVSNEKLIVSDDKYKCYACKRPLDNVVDIEMSLTSNFNIYKSEKIAQLNITREEYIAKNNERLATLEEINTVGTKLKAAHEIQLKALEEARQTAAISDNRKIVEELGEVNDKISKFALPEKKEYKSTEEDEAMLRDWKIKLQQEQSEIANHVACAKAEDRVAALMHQETATLTELAKMEKDLNMIELYEKARKEVLVTKINAKFEYVQFKLFEKLVNGGDEPTCVCLLGGVPFNDLNTASKIWAGIDIINTLSRHYNFWAPIWIDNRESTTSIPETASQIINLYVDDNFKTLTII
jgi:DNA repair exonuclease SbcCD ATPase subunit